MNYTSTIFERDHELMGHKSFAEVSLCDVSAVYDLCQWVRER